MTENRTQHSMNSPYKTKKNQFFIGITVLVLIIIIGLVLSNKSPKLGFFWVSGISFGFILQKSRFCFTASMRDPYLLGTTTLTKAVLIMFAITSIGFTAIKYGAYSNGLNIPGQLYVVPISIATAIGAFMFGIGMVISGGCASGTLMRFGEGFHIQVISLIFFVVGALWGVHDFGWWDHFFISKGRTIFLPDIFGWFGAIVVQLLLISILYILADKWENKKSNF